MAVLQMEFNWTHFLETSALLQHGNIGKRDFWGFFGGELVLKFVATWICCIFLDFSTNIILDFCLDSFSLIFCGLREICSFEVNKN